MIFYSSKISILVVLLSAITVLSSCRRKSEDFSHIDKAVTVEFIRLGNSPFGNRHTYVGKIESAQQTQLSFRNGGVLRNLYVSVGSRVKKGDLIAVTDSTTAYNALLSARASLREATDAYERLRLVHDNKAINEAQWMEMQTRFEQAVSIEAIAANELAACRITAPFSGVITSCEVANGETILPGQTVVTLSDMTNMQARFSVPESEWSQLREKQHIDVEVPACNRTFTAVVNTKKPSANMLTHTYTLTAQINDAEHAGLLSGMVCKVYCPTDDKQGIIVPANCIHTRREGQALWTVRNLKAHRQIISVSEYVKDGVIIRGELQAGDSIITSGYQKLYEGCPVKVP